ncbi:hypothetical protein BGX27_010635 [Mortierella sp. AM989]|nr:hypothetical protein BGX27_010635 [Mortierella sp. AM989]
MNNDQTNKNEGAQRTGKIHSTHSPLETFDQVTREREMMELEKKQNEAMSTSKSSDNDGRNSWHHPGSEKEANSAVQFDRDIQQSRRMSDSDRQKASGTGRSGSWSVNQPYIE